MSRTQDMISTRKPSKLPYTESVVMEESVTGIGGAETLEKDGRLYFVIGPTFYNSPRIPRKLLFSRKKNPKVDFKYAQAGEILLDGKKTYLLLENVQ
ncbi:MAG: hypothetical protein LiPW41_486 [Parcubacteria group bacterium LiPW_41]|nr:MAG: hypothetical protein LiPW41_486 [Parcubacteria group bacterium LiPW_41]